MDKSWKSRTYSYQKDNNGEDKKAKCTKKCVIKRKHKFKDYKNCLEVAQIENKINYLVGGSGSGKTNALLNLINHEPEIDTIFLFARDPYEAKYQFLITKRESTELKVFKWFKSFYWTLRWYGWYLYKNWIIQSK